jgi:Asp-tRNA(Asn)/Glu-tRNA(Gln) amidotransferase A subunit family amidase
MSDMAVSGTGELTAAGPVRNLRDRDHLSGHSSSESAVAVVRGDVDGLPVELMLVDRHLKDTTVLRAGHAFEDGFNQSL